MPAIDYSTPRWIGQPADPAAHYQAGFQIGVHLGATQAAQMYQQQQLEMQRQHELMAAQEQMVEKAYQAQVLGMKASEMARKHQANYEFRSRVASGEDPSQVLMELAPELGENPASMIHDRAMEGQGREMMAYRNANMQRLADTARLNREERAREADARLKGSEPVVPVIDTYGDEQWIRNPKTGHSERLNKTVNKQQFITQNLSKWMTNLGITDENEAADRLGKFYDQKIKPPSKTQDDWLQEFQDEWEQATPSKDPLGIRDLLK